MTKRRRIGTVVLKQRNITLQYFFFGNRQEGYGLEIIAEENGVVTQEICRNISKYSLPVLSLGKEIVRGTVFPGFLAEIVEERQWK